MRILFSMRHLGSLRMYESVLRQLAARGHEVDIVASRRDLPGTETAPEDLLADVQEIRWIWEDVRVTVWTELAANVRIWLDYLRYCAPAYADRPRLKRQIGERVPLLLRRVTEWPLVRIDAGRRALAACLRVVERALPLQQGLDALVRESGPDVVLLTPLLRLGSSQIEVLRSARAQGARTALCVASWDHLSSKSRMGELPDRAFVWNETQRQEAVELHGMRADCVTVTGAQCYDQWFGRSPARTREQFCSMVGLPVDGPFVLYACSALSPEAPTEARFVRRWIEEIRSGDDPVLRSAAVLIRPHPQRLAEWRETDVSDLPDVTVYGSHPLDEQSKEDYFDSLYHCSAVVGLLTSVFLEASILAKPVHTIILPEFYDRQQSLFHFDYLLTVGGGLLRAARSFDEHRAQLAGSLRALQRADLNAGFVGAFIRPHGLDGPATDRFVEAVEEYARAPAPAPARQPEWAPPLRMLLLPLAWAVHHAVGRARNPADRTSIELQQARRRDHHRREREAADQRREAEREAERRDKARRAEVARTAALHARQARIDAGQRQKRELKAAKERGKRQRERAKLRASVLAQIKRRIGVS